LRSVGQKVNETPSQPIAGHSGVCLSPHTMEEDEIERIMVPG
jgi:hypothetical protein